MAQDRRVAIDLLGAELSAYDLIKGALDVRRTHPECQLTFLCDENEIDDGLICDQEIVHCDIGIGESDSLRHVLNGQIRSSMHVGMSMLKNDEVDAFVSVGSTGALMALGRHMLDSPEGIDRPAVIKEFIGRLDSFWMLDLGANIVRRPITLVQFAYLGGAYASEVGGVKNPKIALLNIGIEQRKGPALLRDTALALENDSDVNFVGFVEPNHIFDGAADVVVTDGYAGNIALKAVEGTANFIRDLFLAEFAEDESKRAQQLVKKKARKKFSRLMKKLDSQQHNGASFVGLNGVVVKSHNSTTQAGMTAAVRQAIREIQANVPSKIQNYFNS